MSDTDWRELAAIFAGGAAGALLRVWLGRHFSGGAPGWPWVTFSINVSGSFALGWLVTRLQERLPPSTYPRPLLGTGFCGAYTTFSTMQVELLTMIEDGRYGLAAGYAATSLAAGGAAIWIGTAFGRRVRTLA
ncbi:MAG TPA: fluoride efflux transporter CrcB [Solirubrobacteraceae bacterium]|nr:fluoride efflux transporter CrcB [Solirubrobacteraceae bacterium]